MPSRFSLLCLTMAISLLSIQAARAEGPDFLTVIGTVEKLEKETLIISTHDKPKKSVELKITGTSKFHLLTPQNRGGKTVMTQRAAETTDLEHGQSIAVIYTLADKENVLLTAVVKAMDKEKK